MKGRAMSSERIGMLCGAIQSVTLLQLKACSPVSVSWAAHLVVEVQWPRARLHVATATANRAHTKRQISWPALPQPT